MAQPDSTAVVATTTEAIVENADRLGLITKIRLATITDGSDPARVLAVFDGDTEPVGMISMLGTLIRDQRVYVHIVPPGNNYITGIVATTLTGCRLRSAVTSVAAGVLTNMSWDTIDEQVGGIFLSTTPRIFIDVPEDGVYTLHAQINSAAATNAVRNLLNIATTISTVTGMPASPARSNYVNGEAIISVDLTTRWNAGDQFVVQIFQNTAASPVNVTGWFTMYRVGP